MPFFDGSLKTLNDPWARREAWRNHPFYSIKNRRAAMFPGVGIAAAIFSVYLAYDHWYNTEGPGKVEKEKWAKWMEERDARIGHQHAGDHGHH